MIKMQLFGAKHKPPHELVKLLNENLTVKSLSDARDEATLKRQSKVSFEFYINSLKVDLQMFGKQRILVMSIFNWF